MKCEYVDRCVRRATPQKASSDSLRLTDFSRVDVPGLRCKLQPCACQSGQRALGAIVLVKFGAERALAHQISEPKYEGTSLIRNRPPPWDHHRTLGMVLL